MTSIARVIALWWPAALTLAVLTAVIGGAVVGMLMAGGDPQGHFPFQDRYTRSIIFFTVIQAFLSALLSIVLAIPVARAVHRRRFPGRKPLIRVLGLPMVIPTIVGVLGLVAIYGRSGWLNTALGAVGIDGRFDVYGLQGVLVAHVFFNMPFAARLLLQGWGGIPAESWRLAGQLGASELQTFRLVEWPMIRQIVPGLFALVFLLCFTSFSVVLVLGGGPPNATIEVAIYQALRFDFDLPRVSALAIIQVVFCGGLALAAARAVTALPDTPPAGRTAARFDGTAIVSRLFDGLMVAIGAIVLLAPLAAVAVAAARGPITAALADPALWEAAARSAVVGLAAGTLSLILGFGIVATLRRIRHTGTNPTAAAMLEAAGSLVLVIPPFVIGAGLFVLARQYVNVFDIGLPLVIVINALMGLPFVVRVLTPPATQALLRYDRLTTALGMRLHHRLRLVDWPLLRRPAALALALTTALAMGDFGVIALFGTPETRTLPLYLYQQMGSYQLGRAAVTAAVLVGMTLSAFLLIERIVGGRNIDDPS